MRGAFLSGRYAAFSIPMPSRIVPANATGIAMNHGIEAIAKIMK